MEQSNGMHRARAQEACLEQVEALLSSLRDSSFTVCDAYLDSLKRYINYFPAAPEHGNMLLADCEARVLRGLFEAEHEILPPALAGGLRQFFALHQAACVYFDSVRRFYDDVRARPSSGALRETDIADFLDSVE
jgi:hypothetical protein